jgi:hypothetical protein
VAKEAYYFSHDSNARHDPKITAMRSVYGTEGYGWFWILVEMMREADGYKLDLQKKYSINAYAMQMHTDCSTAEKFIHDCIHEFGLFETDGEYFWSRSLLRRMEYWDQISAKRREAARVRWSKERDDADGMQMHSNSNPNEMQRKEKKIKEKKIKKVYSEKAVNLTAYLIDLMKQNNPKAKIPSNLDKWYDEMDKLERIDGYTEDQIRDVITWSQNDSFWRANILSATKLREKFATLFMQMQRPQKTMTTTAKPTVISKLQEMYQEAMQLEASGSY